MTRKQLRRTQTNPARREKKKTFYCQFCEQPGHEATNCGTWNAHKIFTCMVFHRQGHKNENCSLLNTKQTRNDVLCTMCQRRSQ